MSYNINFGTYRNCHSVERLVIAVYWVDHHRTGYWSDAMNSEPHYVIGWISRSPVPVQDEVIIVEVTILRGGVTSCDQPRKCARYGSAHETGVEEYNVLSIISDVVPSWGQVIPGVDGCDTVISRVSYAPYYVSIKLEEGGGREKRTYRKATNFMREIYLCKLCESSAGHINLYCINFLLHHVTMHRALECININLSRCPFD